MDMTVDLNGLILKNPVIAASGTYGYNDEFGVFCDVGRLGAVVTKAITLEARSGNDWKRIFEVEGGLINSIGLENVGIAEYMSLRGAGAAGDAAIHTIVNIAGSSIEEYTKLAKICEENNKEILRIRHSEGLDPEESLYSRNDEIAVELNLSCPNVAHGCLEFGTDEEALYSVVSAVRAQFSGHLIAKLTPNVTSIEKIALAAQKAGANAVSAINTLKALGLKLNYVNGEFKKEYVRGGLSGRVIKPVALGAVERIAKTVDIPVIGIGGIYDLNDVLEFFAVGAEAVQVGTANFTHPDICEKLADELLTFMQSSGFATLKELKENLRKEAI